MNDIRIRDTIRDKKTGVVGTVISDSPFMGMYYVAMGECRGWISYENAEKPVTINKDAIQNDNRMLSSYGLEIKSLQNRIKELEEENAKLKKRKMSEINVGDTIRNKKTGVVGKVISDSSFIYAYRVDTGEHCEWMEYKDVEKVEVIEDEGKQ